jgi:DNA oxidative demethylase
MLPPGIRHIPGYLDPAAQRALVEDIRAVVEAAPLYTPEMPKTGKPMSVRMTNCGVLGWVTDRERGYRYQPTHPVTGDPWPAIPPRLLDLWREVADYPHAPEACLVNFYADTARMGLHQDRDERDLAAPATTAFSGSAARNAAIGPFRSGFRPETSSFSAARDGLPSTALTGSIRTLQPC